jgi:hypothetical protein
LDDDGAGHTTSQKKIGVRALNLLTRSWIKIEP